MKSEERTQRVFIADDGKEFLDELECRKYETEVLQRLRKMKFFRVMFCPDLTEGRGLQKAAVFAVDMDYSHGLAVEDWCERNLGSRIGWVQGCSPVTAWTLREIDHDGWDTPVSVKWGGQHFKPKRVLISASPVPTIEPDEHLVWIRGDGDKGGFKEYGKE